MLSQSKLFLLVTNEKRDSDLLDLVYISFSFFRVSGQYEYCRKPRISSSYI